MDIDAPTAPHADWLPIVPQDDFPLTESSILREPPNSPAVSPEGSDYEEDEDDNDLFRDTQARVSESLVLLQKGGDVTIEPTDADRNESRLVDTFMATGCGCKQNCHSCLGHEAIERHRNSCAELTKPELDMAILGQLAALEHRDTTAGGLHKKEVQRQRNRAVFYFQGKVCRSAFLFLYGIGVKRFKNLQKHYDQHGLSARTHGNFGKTTHHATTMEDAQHALTFLFEYAEIHALLLPGRVPGYKRTDLQVRLYCI